MRSSLFPVALSAVAALSFAPAKASTATTNMNVSIQVVAGCNITLTNISFGAFPANGLSSTVTSTSANGGSLTYACSNGGVTPSLTYGQGGNYQAGNRMKGATTGAFLPYSLNMPTLPALTGGTQTAQITATIPAQGTLPAPDTYSDTVVVTLNY